MKNFVNLYAVKIIDFEKKKMIPLINEQQESYEKEKICNICKIGLDINTMMMKIIVMLKDIVIILVNTEELYIAYAI